MGYSMQQGNSQFHIKKKNFKAGLKAMSEAQVDGQDWEDEGSLLDVLTKLQWEPMLKKNGDIQDLAFQGMKLCDYIEEMFTALAPFVEEGSYIEAVGEDMSHWRWYFDGKTVVEQSPKHIEWE